MSITRICYSVLVGICLLCFSLMTEMAVSHGERVIFAGSIIFFLNVYEHFLQLMLIVIEEQQSEYMLRNTLDVCVETLLM